MDKPNEIKITQILELNYKEILLYFSNKTLIFFDFINNKVKLYKKDFYVDNNNIIVANSDLIIYKNSNLYIILISGDELD